MIVVSDTSPLNYLLLVDAVHVLPELFQQVYIPRRVAMELEHPTASLLVRSWIAMPPAWLQIRSPNRIDANLKLDPGEIHAIGLAEELGADHVLIDEWAARTIAMDRGLHVVGTLGVLDQAAERNLIDLRKTFDLLLQTNFRIDRRLIDQVLERDAKRKIK
jgi:predicted nucleic acid-binding protein